MIETVSTNTSAAKIKELLHMLETTSEECSKISDKKRMLENAAEKMSNIVTFISEARREMEESHICKDYEMLCYSWRQYACSSFISFLLAYDASEKVVNQELLNNAVSKLKLLLLAVKKSYSDIANNPNGRMRIADIYYSTNEGLRMNEPGLFFAHCREKYDCFPIKVSAFITGGEVFWENAANKAEYLYSLAFEVTKQAMELLRAVDYAKVWKASEIIHDYADYISHAADVYGETPPPFQAYAGRLSQALKEIADEAKHNRIKALFRIQEAVAITEDMK